MRRRIGKVPACFVDGDSSVRLPVVLLHEATNEGGDRF